MVFVECRVLIGQLKWNVTGNAIIVIFTKLSMCLLDCSMSSVVHKMTHPKVEVSVYSEMADTASQYHFVLQ
jgi:hypothetical protein